MEKFEIFFYTLLWLTTHFVPPRAQIPKIIVREPYLNNGLSDLHKPNTKMFHSTSSLLYKTPIMSKSSKHNDKRIIWKKSIFSLFSNIWLWTPMVLIHGTKFYFHNLRHHLPLIPSTITTTKILKLCTILLCSAQHILIQKSKKSHFEF